ncbi:MAG: PhzF family phenazine biosynthesis protein [Thermodesulfobacteriota bacterium]
MIYYIVDAFTETAFKGNPAAVCILNKPIPDDLMQNIASEFNLSETAYLLKQSNNYRLRWFSPTTEVDLCGHATLASAHFLWENGMLNHNQDAEFSTNSGIITARKINDDIEMDFPVEEAYETQCPAAIIDGLNIKPEYVAKNRFDYLVEVENEDIVKQLEPNIEVVKNIDCRGVIVTSLTQNSKFDFVSRFFAPRFGIPEDPVTGSAHCALGPYWSKKTGKSRLIGFQASQRGGVVKVEVTKENVKLGGKAVTVATGELIV